MLRYNAPIDDMMFLYEKFNINADHESLGYLDFYNPRYVKDLLLKSSEFASKTLLPLAPIGDEHPSYLENGEVRTPPGFKDAYIKYTKDGWSRLTCNKEHGGNAAPKTVSGFIDEIWSSSNLSFKLFSELAVGAYNCILHNANDEIKNLYLPPIAEGKWGGTMCLTEEQCGTDLGLIETMANPNEDGSFDLNGQKIYITSGEQDITENIIHLVLARTPDAPEGTKGLSLFVVPKVLVNPDGSLGVRNKVRASHVYEKMGIKGVPTCAIEFEGAKGFQIGKEYEGLKNMFVMMNVERTKVGLHGLGLSETAYQNALHFSKHRKQGSNNEGEISSIIEHPDIRKQLLKMKSLIEGERALGFWLSQQTDISLRHKNNEVRKEASDFVALLTPVVKSFFTDLGMEITSDAMQIYGGRGYLKKSGVELLYRDNRITSIYEGTNAIQALDLIYRKIGKQENDVVGKYFNLINENLKNLKNKQIDNLRKDFSKYLSIMNEFTLWLREQLKNNIDNAKGSASDYQRALGYLSVAYMWLLICEKSVEENSEFYEDKLKTANFFFNKVLPQMQAHYLNAKQGSKDFMEFNFDAKK